MAITEKEKPILWLLVGVSILTITVYFYPAMPIIGTVINEVGIIILYIIQLILTLILALR